MKLILTEYDDYCEVEVKDGSLRLHVYSFNNPTEARAFCSGFNCCRMVANSVIQSLPMGNEYKRVKGKA